MAVRGRRGEDRWRGWRREEQRYMQEGRTVACKEEGGAAARGKAESRPPRFFYREAFVGPVMPPPAPRNRFVGADGTPPSAPTLIFKFILKNHLTHKI